MPHSQRAVGIGNVDLGSHDGMPLAYMRLRRAPLIISINSENHALGSHSARINSGVSLARLGATDSELYLQVILSVPGVYTCAVGFQS